MVQRALHAAWPLVSGPGDVYRSGNVAPPQGEVGVDINTMGTSPTPISAPAITEHSVPALPAALLGDGVTTGAGALPRDAYDSAVITRVAGDLRSYLQTCSQRGGDGCQFGEACGGGVFGPSSDFGSLCCVGGTCGGSTTGPDTDGDGIPDATDNCPLIYNPGQANSDGDLEGGDARDITVTFPLSGEITCADPPPTIAWSPEVYNRFKVMVGADPAFSVKITSGQNFLTTAAWTVPLKKWTTICARANPNLYFRVLGKIAGTNVVELSETDVVMVK